MTNELSTEELRETVHWHQCGRCIFPNCEDYWTDLCHITDSGMGGRNNRTPDNLVGMCRYHHQGYDENKRWWRRELLYAWKELIIQGKQGM